METTIVDNIPLLLEQLKAETEKAVDEACLTVDMLFQATSAIDTSAMRSSAHRVTPLADTYDESVSEAEGLRPEATFFPKLEPDKSEGLIEGVAAVAVEYAAYPEYGTVHSPAQPAFIPAVETVRAGYDALIAAAVETAIKTSALR